MGGESPDYLYGIRIDANGNVYASGCALSPKGIASTGAYQTSFGGNTDAMLVKFNSMGTFQWATYYGGYADECSLGLCTDASGNVFITGKTNSPGLASKGAYQTSVRSSYNSDAFLAKFSSSGSLSWATYFGGTGDETSFDATTDASGNVFIVGRTNSQSYISTSGAYQTTISGSGNSYSAFIAKFGNEGDIGWATYYGIDNSTVAEGICADSSGNVFVTGYTTSTGLATSGAYQSAIAGGTDGFLTKFSVNGHLLSATYFGGKGYDVPSGVCIDKSGNVYIAGSTGSNGIASSGAYQTSHKDLMDDAFIAKFNTKGSLSWATYFGGDKNDEFLNMAIGKNDNINICGYTQSTNGIASSGAFQSTMSGIMDGFIASFKSSGALDWSTYYGGNGVDYIYSICADPYGAAYACGYTSSSGMATKGAYHSIIHSNTFGSFITRFSDPFKNNAGLDSIASPLGRSCSPYTYMRVRLRNYGTVPLTSVQIAWSVNNYPQSTYKWKGSLASGDTVSVTLNSTLYWPAGSYSILAYTLQPNGVMDSMPRNDTITTIYLSGSQPNAGWRINKSNVNYYFHVNDSSASPIHYTWLLSDGFHFNGYSFQHKFAKDGSYIIKLITTNTFGCVNEHDSTIDFTADIAPAPNAAPYNINIYPNPFKDKTIIHFYNPQAAQLKISITDMLGKVLYTSSTQQYNAGDNEIEINSTEAGLGVGTYFVSMTIGEDVVVSKVVVMRK